MLRLVALFLFLAVSPLSVGQILTPIISGGKAGFLYRRSLTVDHTKVPNTDQTDFPVLVYASDATLKDSAHGGHVSKSNGADILFFSDAAHTSQIASEIELYDNVNGVLWAHVKVATVATASDTVFYVCYGNSSPPARTANPWNSSYASVWHLTSLTADSVGANTLTNSNTVTSVAGKVGNAANFVSASKQSLYRNSPSGLPTGNDANTFELWFQMGSDDIQAFAAWGSGLGGNGARELIYWPKTTGKLDANWNSGAVRSLFTYGTAWHHVAITCYVTPNGINGNCRFFLDGADTSTDITETTRAVVATIVQIGNADDQAPGAGTCCYVNGWVDEVRISTMRRADDWIKTGYANQNAPGTFLAVGAEVSL